MSGAVLVLLLPVLAAALVYLLRRWPLPSTALAGLAAVSLAALLWTWPNEGPVIFLGRVIRPGQPIVLLGQQFQMNPTSQWVIGFLSLALAGAYLGAWRVSQGRSFFPFGLILLSLVASSLMIQPIWHAPAVLALAASLSVLVIQAGQRGSTRGATRVLWLPILAIPLFLLAGWYLEQLPLDPDDQFPLQAAAALASLGLLLLLAPWPLHGPALSLGYQAPPLVAAWLLTALVAVPLALLQELLTNYAWLQGASLSFGLLNLRLSELLVYGGLAGAIWAGLAALVQRDLRRQWSYVAMFSHGAILVSLGLGARSSWGLVWLLMLTRTAALLVSAFGLAVINQRAGGRCDHMSIQGLATRLPWTSAAYLLGGLSLAGLPLTAGFAGQWALLQALGSRDWLLAALLLLGALGVVAGLARSQQVLLGHLENLLLEREERLMVIIAASGLVLIILPALWPQVWRGTITAAVTAFSSAAGGL